MLKRSIERRPLLTGLIAGLCLGEQAWAQQCSSLNGTLVTTVGPTIIDASQESFALNGSATTDPQL